MKNGYRFYWARNNEQGCKNFVENLENIFQPNVEDNLEECYYVYQDEMEIKAEVR